MLIPSKVMKFEIEHRKYIVKSTKLTTACIFWCTFDAQFQTFITSEGIDIFQSLKKQIKARFL